MCFPTTFYAEKASVVYEFLSLIVRLLWMLNCNVGEPDNRKKGRPFMVSLDLKVISLIQP